MRAVIITADGVQDVEIVYPLYRLQEAGYAVDVAVRGNKPVTGIKGVPIKSTIDVPDVENRTSDLLVIPGGVKAMEKMRLDVQLVEAVTKHHKSGCVIASICSGAQMLISARLVKGRTVSAYPAMQIDIENAGGKFHAGPAVVDDRIVSAPHYDYLGPWMALVLKTVEREAAERQ